MEQATANQALFDETGRRIPYSGMRVHNQVSRQYFRLIQPPVDYRAIWKRSMEYMPISDAPSAEEFAEGCSAMLNSLSGHSLLANLMKGVHVPFLCPANHGTSWTQQLQQMLPAVGRSYSARYTDADFIDLCPGRPDDKASFAPGSRYEAFERARTTGPIIGIYFPICLAEYDLASQRQQMETLPESVDGASIVLSGGIDAAAALIGSPELLWNEDSYPHHLCLSAIQEPDDQVVYTFEAYGRNLRFRYRSNMLTQEITQLSEQWAGGLTIFVSVG